MVITAPDSEEGMIRKVIDQVADICLSEEFDGLRRELEVIYEKCHMEDALMTAFQDALYAMMAEREGVRAEPGLAAEK